jgi:hypothetical protein
MTKHVKTHGLTGDKDPAVVKAMRDAEAADRDRLRAQFRPTKEPALSFDYNEKRALEAWTAYFCSTFGSFRDIERPQFKHFWSTITNVPPPITCRRAFRNYVVSEAEIALKASIGTLGGKYVTLAVDSGTIWHRYLTVVALVAGYDPLLIAATPSKTIGDGRLTAVNVANYLRSVVIRLTAAGATVVAIVADNASNLQAALRLIVGDADEAEAEAAAPADPDSAPDDDLEAGQDEETGDTAVVALERASANGHRILPQRCEAHTGQLIVDDLLKGPFANYIAPFRDPNKDYVKLTQKTPVATRWNSTFEAIDDIVKHKKAEMKNDTDHTSLQTLANLLRPFARMTDTLQSNDAGLWQMFAALQKLLRHFVQESADHQAVRRALVTRASMLISPALFVLAWMSPNLPRQQVSAEHAATAIACHALLLGDASPLATAYRPAVTLEKISKSGFLARMPQPTVSSIDVEVAQLEANADLAKRLLSIAPTEASVERVFSALKINVSRLRTRCDPKTAVSQVMHNVCRKFLQTGYVHQPSTDEIDPETFLWVVQHGAAHNKLPETKRDKLKCGKCGTSHEDPAKYRTFGAAYENMVTCIKCAQWFGVSCLSLTQREAANIMNINYVCDHPACQARAHDKWMCDAYLEYLAENGFQDGGVGPARDRARRRR